jgi:hypothetical protein
MDGVYPVHEPQRLESQSWSRRGGLDLARLVWGTERHMHVIYLAHSQANNMYNIHADCLRIGPAIGWRTVESKREHSQ